jgi:hypothetical protein
MANLNPRRESVNNPAVTPDNPSRTARLTAAILRDRERAPQVTNVAASCFLCGRSYCYVGPSGDDSGMFCTGKCRDAFDAGHQPDTTPTLKRATMTLRSGSRGFYVKCAGCQKDFESKGLRCCSSDCERSARERETNAEVLAEVGMEVAAKRICEREGCGGTIPKWRKGRLVASNVRFCCSRCAGIARRRNQR